MGRSVLLVVLLGCARARGQGENQTSTTGKPFGAGARRGRLSGLFLLELCVRERVQCLWQQRRAGPNDNTMSRGRAGAGVCGACAHMRLSS